MSRHVDTGATNQTIVFWAFEASGDAAEVTTSDAVSYRRDNDGREGTPVSLTLVARTTPGQHRDAAITYKGDGKHEIDLPDAAVATDGEVTLEVTKSGVASYYVEKLEVSAALATKAVADSIAEALAGGSPVEPTGTNIRDQLQQIYDGLFPADPDTDPVVITPGTGDITTGWMVCLDETGEAEKDVSVYCQMSDVPSSETGFAHSSRIQTATSAANGVVEFSLVKGASYFFWRGKASPNGTLDPVAIPSDAGSTYELPSIKALV